MESVWRRRLVAAASAAVAASADLSQKLIDKDAFHHERSAAAVGVMALVALGLLVLVPRLDSTAVVLGAGIGAGGAIGNFASAVVWSAGVPDPLVVGYVAFNLADVFAVGGAGVLLASTAVYTLRNRDALRRPI